MVQSLWQAARDRDRADLMATPLLRLTTSNRCAQSNLRASRPRHAVSRPVRRLRATTRTALPPVQKGGHFRMALIIREVSTAM